VELDLQFRHENQKIVRPRLFPVPEPRMKALDINGSKRVADLLIGSDDPKFARFRTPATHWRNRKTLTLSEGIEIAESYIRACDSDEGREVDPRLCAGIGGHIHIATITPAEFKWIKEPKKNG